MREQESPQDKILNDMKPEQKRDERDEPTPGAKPTKDLDKGPTHPHQRADKGDHQKPRDAVDEESMESFPASDPPSHTRSGI